ncbi:MAG: alkaline phosphatase family protein [Actinobacteria bacterium]|nr:alkaline phosphatase family protein [Actinomycetota bacterium]
MTGRADPGAAGDVEMSAIPKVLVIGLDALTPRLVEEWIAEGRLPNLGKFLSQGAWGALNSVPNRNSAPAWSTMVTGLNPGKHGIYWFTEDNPESYDYKFVNGSFRRGKAFWNVLSEEKQQVGIVNVPLTFPAETVNGTMVAGLDSPSVDHPNFTYPPDLRTEVKEAAGGEYHVHPALAQYVVAGKIDEGLDRLHNSIDKRSAVAKHLMSTRPWDAFMVVFTESDVVQHFFWRHMANPSPGDSSRAINAIRGTYEHLDRVVGELIELAGDDTVHVVVSDHGARYDHGLARALPSWLEQLGLLSYRDESRRTGLRPFMVGTASKLYRQVDKRLPSEIKHKLSGRLPWIHRRMQVMMSFAKLDWAKTQAYTDGQRPEIWVNLKGRQSQGIVAPEDYERVRQEMIDRLSSAVCSTTGKPLVRRVMRREDVYSGPYVDRSPDLIVEWMDEGACLDIRYPDGTELSLTKQHLPDDPYDRLLNGGHDQHGIVGIIGPGVRRASLQDAQIADIAPTVLYLRDAPIPEDLDGVVLEAAIEPQLLESRKGKTGGSAVRQDGDDAGYSEEEAAEVHDRLQALGYVE